MGSYNITFTIIFSTPVDVTSTTARSFIILCSFTHLVSSHFLTAAPYNETHNHYCSKVSCSNPLLYQMTFLCPDSSAISISHSSALITHCLFGLLAAPVMQRRGVIKMIYECNPPPPRSLPKFLPPGTRQIWLRLISPIGLKSVSINPFSSQPCSLSQTALSTSPTFCLSAKI